MRWVHVLVFIVMSWEICAQAITTNQWSSDGVTITYGSARPEGGFDELLIGFYDTSDPSWRFETWAQELSWLAESRRAALLVPDSNTPRLDSALLTAWLSAVSDSLDASSIAFVALGEGVRQAEPLIFQGIRGLIIAPTDTLSSKRGSNSAVVGVIDSRDGDRTQAVIKSLEYAGAWIHRKTVLGEDDYYFEGHKQVILDLFGHIDSTYLRLQDSTVLASLESSVISISPEVLRQGKVFEAKVFVAVHGEFRIEVLDLSGEVVKALNMFLPKGEQRIKIPTKTLNWGVYKVEIDGPGIMVKQKLMIRG